METTTTNPLATSNPLIKMFIIRWSNTIPQITLLPRRNTLRTTNSQLSKIETVTEIQNILRITNSQPSRIETITEIQDSNNHPNHPINSLHTKMTMITECPKEEVTTLTTKLSRKLTEIIALKSLNMTHLSWSCVVKVVEESLILTVLRSIKLFAEKFSKRKEKSLMLNSTEL